MLNKFAGLFSPGGSNNAALPALVPRETFSLSVPRDDGGLGKTCCAFDPVNKLVARGTCFGQVFLFGASFCVELELDCRGPVTALLFAGAHKLLVVFARRLVEVFNCVTASSLCVRELPEQVLCLAAPCGRNYVFCGTNTGKCLVLNLEQDVFISSYAVLSDESFGVKKDSMVTLCIDPADESILLFGFAKCGLVVEWSLRDAKALNRYQGPRNLQAVAFKRDGRMIVTGYQDGSIVIFNRAEPGKILKSYFGGASHRSVQGLAWSERDGNNIILAVGSTPANSAVEGVAILSGNPLSRATVVAAAEPVCAFFLDPSPHLSSVDPPAFIIATSSKIMAFDTASFEQIALPTFFATPRCPVNLSCLSGSVFDPEGALARSMTPTFPQTGKCGLLGGCGVMVSRNSTEFPVVIFKALDSGILLVENGDRSTVVKQFRGGRACVFSETLPSPCVGVAVVADREAVAWWSPKELVVLAFFPKVDVVKKSEVKSAEAKRPEPAAPMTAQVHAAESPVARVAELVPPAAASPAVVALPVVAVAVEASPAIVPAVAAEPAASGDAVAHPPVAVVSPAKSGVSSEPVAESSPVAQASAVVAPSPAALEVNAIPDPAADAPVSDRVAGTPLCYVGRDGESKTPFLVRNENVDVGGTWSTVLHLSSSLIHAFASFEDLFFVAFNCNLLGVWGIEDEVAVCELPSFEEHDDVVIGVHAFRDTAVLLSKDEEHVVSVVKVLVVSARRAVWLLELHSSGVRTRQLRHAVKKDAARVDDALVLFCVVGADGKPVSELSASVEDASSRFVVAVEPKRAVVHRFSGKHSHVVCDEASCYLFDTGSYCAAAEIMEHRNQWFLAVVVVGNACANLLLLPLVDVSKGPFAKLPIYDAERAEKQFPGGSYYCIANKTVCVSTSLGEQLFFPLCEEGQDEDKSMARVEGLRLWNPEARVKEKPKALGGWLGGLFAPNNDELATLFAKRVEIPGPAKAASAARSSARASPAAGDKVHEVKNIMEENKRKLAERGEHINEVGERASQLEDQSNEFARNIAKLKQKQQNSWFF